MQLLVDEQQGKKGNATAQPRGSWGFYCNGRNRPAWTRPNFRIREPIGKPGSLWYTTVSAFCPPAVSPRLEKTLAVVRALASARPGWETKTYDPYPARNMNFMLENADQGLIIGSFVVEWREGRRGAGARPGVGRLGARPRLGRRPSSLGRAARPTVPLRVATPPRRAALGSACAAAGCSTAERCSRRSRRPAYCRLG